MSKKLVVYFSASGKTAVVAEKLAKAVNADVFEIKPKVLYTAEDLDWRNENARSSIEMKNLAFRPEIAEKDVEIDDYDVIFVGFPIWWHIAPTIINTFLERYDFSGKKIVLFATAGGSGFGGTAEALRGSVSSTAELVEGFLLNRNSVENELEDWLKKFHV